MADDTAAAPETPPEANGDAMTKRKKLLRILALVVVTAGTLWGIWYFLTQAGRVPADNSYVGAG